MGWRRPERPGTGGSAVGALAVLVPLHARSTLGNESNLSAGSSVTTELRLVVRPDDGSDAGRTPAQDVVVRVPNWLRIVFHYAGANESISGQLPAEVEVAVQLDPAAHRVVAVDVERAEAELAAYRTIATRWWKETEAPLADVRGLVSAPRAALRGVRGVAGAWRAATAQLRADLHASDPPPTAAHSESEREQIRRTANVVSHRLADDPKMSGRLRASALEAGPMMVANVRSGSMAMADLDTWLQFQVGAGTISESEATAWRTEASAGLTRRPRPRQPRRAPCRQAGREPDGPVVGLGFGPGVGFEVGTRQHAIEPTSEPPVRIPADV